MSTQTQAAARAVNPATGEEIATYPFLNENDLDAFFDHVTAGFKEWGARTVAARAEVLRAMAAKLRASADTVAASITAEMGKPTQQAHAEVQKAATVLEWYAEHGPGMLSDETTMIGDEARVVYEPLGPILAIEPWNFPVWQVMRGSIAILLGGNPYVLKPAPTTVGSALLLEKLWMEAGLPKGAFSVLNAEPDVISHAISHPVIAAVTLTGSVGAGSAVAAQAGRDVKKVVLELGGSDPFIVLADADLDAAVEAAVTGRFQNSGQVCIAAKRIIVEEPVVAAFTERFVARVRALKVGDPTSEDTFVGPIARADLREEIHRQVQETVEQGADVLLGGSMISGPGYFYEPTVLGGVRPGMVAFDQEIFGPVAPIIAAVDREEAVHLANLSAFGLSASVWTADAAVADEIASALEVGGVFINRISVSDPRIPIGGVKKSGFGRELSHFGIHEFLNAKAIWSDPARTATSNEA